MTVLTAENKPPWTEQVDLPGLSPQGGTSCSNQARDRPSKTWMYVAQQKTAPSLMGTAPSHRAQLTLLSLIGKVKVSVVQSYLTL